MPELPVKETRFSDLHLPEIKRDDIVRSLSEMRLPDIDLTRLERPKIDLPKIDLPDAVANFEWPRISSSDVSKAMAGAAAAVHIGRKTRRPTWPFAIGGLIVAAIVAAVIVSNETVRARLAGWVHAVTERVGGLLSGDAEGLDIDHDEAIAFDAAETKPIEASPFSETSSIDATGYPDGLGIDHDAAPAFEEATTGRE